MATKEVTGLVISAAIPAKRALPSDRDSGLISSSKTSWSSYLRLSDLRLRLGLGLLINFHEAPISRGIHRVVNNLPGQ